MTDNDNTTSRTLYLCNLPSRPKSKDHYTRLLLKHINDQNKFVLNPSLPLTQNNLKDGLSNDQIDNKYGIVQLSMSCKQKMRNQSFITFNQPENARKFKETFTGNLKIGGKLVDIQFAKKESFASLAETNSAILKTLVKRRSQKKLLHANKEKSDAAQLKRHVRRLKFKLRRKGLEETEISKAVEKFKQKSSSKSTVSTKAKPKKPKDEELIKPKAAPTITENPPCNILLVQNLPPNVDTAAVSDLFRNDDFKEVRLVNIKNLAFVEYNTLEGAVKQKEKLGLLYKWKSAEIVIAYAKK